VEHNLTLLLIRLAGEHRDILADVIDLGSICQTKTCWIVTRKFAVAYSCCGLHIKEFLPFCILLGGKDCLVSLCGDALDAVRNLAGRGPDLVVIGSNICDVSRNQHLDCSGWNFT
jgi:hypothetical protein